MLEAISTNYRGGYFDGKQYICVCYIYSLSGGKLFDGKILFIISRGEQHDEKNF